ncbi:polyphosphate kinase 2 [Arenimonas sp.]|jgi:polyphosphate kinase 2|uniref:polyphosphate kinase 2 n=1 Tax=Arenimonas sp. TaxID=1872635 RepID=UPI0037BE87FE
MSKKIGKKEYETELAKLQIELNRITHWVQKNGKRVVVLVEGRDTAGKGGVIAAIKAHMNSRSCRTVALGKPTEAEASQWYFQRYLAHLPAAGEFVFFDRSWYNRAGVDKVMGFCTPQQTKDFLKQVPVLEKMLVDDGILVFKYWLTVDQDEQEERFRERLDDPLKQWKLSPVDILSRAKYDDYTAARETMLEATHTKHAPWTLVDFNSQKLGRLNLIRHFIANFPDDSVKVITPEWKPLSGKPRKEQYRVPPKPIKAN